MTIKRAILVHGYNVKDGGAGTTGRLKRELEIRGFKVVQFSPGWRGLLRVRFGNAKLAAKLASMIRPGDVLIGHSDGCNLVNQACWLLSDMVTPPQVDCVYCNPALDIDTPLAPQVKKALVMHSMSDRVVYISKWLVFHRWGQMGRIGYKDNLNHDTRYVNCTYESIGVPYPGHSGVFSKIGWRASLLNRIEKFLIGK